MLADQEKDIVTEQRPTPTVAIVGGGFSGGAVAFHLAHMPFPFRIIVFEPRTDLGRGLAYDTTVPTNRINVPAGRMSMLPEDEGHFARWLEQSGAAQTDTQLNGPCGNAFPAREVFGRYVAAQIAPLIERGRIEHVRKNVVDIRRDGQRWEIRAENGRRFRADILVLAATHPPPAVPNARLGHLSGDPRLIADPLAPDALSDISATTDIVIMGTALTMADIVAALDARHHVGRITAFSRHGLLSREHAGRTYDLVGDFAKESSTALALLKHIRAEIRHATRLQQPWQAVIDAVRRDAQTFWPQLSRREQAKIVRHLRTFWDVHRFRIAPQVSAVLKRKIADGSLEILAAHLETVTAAPEHLRADLRDRRTNTPLSRTAGAFILASGPGHRGVIETNPAFRSLARDGFLKADSLGLGIDCDRSGRACGRDGRSEPTLLVAGPLARATFGELMGLPQVSAYARTIASEVAKVASLANDP